MDLSGYGINTTLLPGWEGRIMKRAEPEPGQGTGPNPQFVAETSSGDGNASGNGWEKGTGGSPRTNGAFAERTFPIMHMANFAIPDDRGDFGSGAVELMNDGDLFITLFEYGPESVGQPLFATDGLPRNLTPSQFSPNALQRTITGQSGLQIFFTEANRAFCLFIALGSHSNRAALAQKANAALANITIEPR